MIHFFRFDDRFCGSTQWARRVTLDPNEVTCPQCKARDTFVLGPAGQAALAKGQDAFDEWVRNG